VALQFNGGVVLGADSRVSTGTYISNRASDKITHLADSIYLLRSGSAADTQAVSDYGKSLNMSSGISGEQCEVGHGRPFTLRIVLITYNSCSGAQCATSQSSIPWSSKGILPSAQ